MWPDSSLWQADSDRRGPIIDGVTVADLTSTIAAVPRLLGRCHTLDQSIEALTAEVRRSFPVDRTSVRVLDREGLHLVLVGAWSSTRSNLPVGTRVRAAATSFDTILAQRRPVFSVETAGENPPSLLDQILLHEGFRSWVSCPLEEYGRPVGILSFSSRAEGAFRRVDAPPFVRLAAACQVHLLRQARAVLRQLAPGGSRVSLSR
jgi:GAF domain-containing protein